MAISRFTLQAEEADSDLAARKMNMLKSLGLERLEDLKTAENAINYLRVLYFAEKDLYFCEDEIQLDEQGLLKYDQPDNFRKAMFKAKQLCAELGLLEEVEKVKRIIADFCSPANSVKAVDPAAREKHGIASLVDKGYRGKSPIGCFGLFASEDIPAETVILAIHEKDIINLFTCLRDSIFKTHAIELLDHGHHVDTVLLLYLIHLRDNHSVRTDLPESVGMFMQGLPKSFGTLLDWPAEAVEALGVAAVVREVQEHKDILFSIFKTLPASLCPTFEDLLWAKTLCSSRSFMNGNMTPSSLIESEIFERHVPNRRLTCVVPGADLLNHSPRGQCSVPQFDEASRCLVIRAETDIPINTEIFLNYGGISNWEFLFHQGFQLGWNAYDAVDLEIEAPDMQAEEEFHQLGLPTVHYVRRGLPKISPKLVKAAKIVAGEDAQSAIVELLQSMAEDPEPAAAAASWWIEEYGEQVALFREAYKSLIAEAVESVKKFSRKNTLLKRRR